MQNDTEGVVATIENRDCPGESVSIRYLREENAFVTSGIRAFFGEKELLIPAYLLTVDLQLMGTIVSAILERLSLAREAEEDFRYASAFEALGRTYTLTPFGEYVKLEMDESGEVPRFLC